MSNFSGGAHLNWTISGNVLITITNKAAPNAVLSGLFFDPVATVSTVTSVGSSENASTYGQSVTFTATVSDTSGGVPTAVSSSMMGQPPSGLGLPSSGSGNSATSTFTTFDLDGRHPFLDHGRLHSDWEFWGSSGIMSQTVNPAGDHHEQSAQQDLGNSAECQYGPDGAYDTVSSDLTAAAAGTAGVGVSQRARAVGWG